ncbi:MAG: DUF4199 family protein [Chitinophagaceae bacterium]
MNLRPAIKGLIAAVIMIAIALVTYYSGMPANSPFQFLVYAVYAIGVVWTVVAYSKTSLFTGKFGDSFNQGFRCFIVITLMMVLFTATFSSMHPEFAEESSKYYREELLKQKDTLPPDIEAAVAKYKKNYTMTLVYGSIIGYLIIGAVVTAVSSLIIIRRK